MKPITKNLRVIIVPPGEPGYEATVPDELPALQAIVGGYIETVRFGTRALAVCNDEGRLRKLPENRLGLCGTFFLVGYRGDKFVSLSDGQIKSGLSLFATPAKEG